MDLPSVVVVRLEPRTEWPRPHRPPPPPELTNRLLAALPQSEFRRLEGTLERITATNGEILLEAGGEAIWAYFPEESVVSVVRILSDGSMIEVGLVGFDGFIGVHSLAPTAEQPYRLIVQNSGAMRRLPLTHLRGEFARGGKLQELLLLFMSAFLMQISQTAACNRLHKIDERLARWLLMMRDRVPSDELNLTQEFLSHMLGIRLAGVNEAVRRLSLHGLVKHRRNVITILDRAGLEAAACECYAFVRDARGIFDR